MSDLAKVVDQAYAGYDAPDQPLAAYAGLVGAYGLAFSAFVVATATGKIRLPKRIAPLDLALVGLATHKLSRLIAKDEVTAIVRAPFVRYKGAGPAPGEVREVPRGEGLQKAVGQLVTCPDCLTPGVAAVGLLGLAFAPRTTRFVASIFAVVAVSTWLNTALDRAEKG